MPTSSPEARRAEAKSFRESEDFQRSADLFESLWADDAVREAWDGWGLAHCLRKLNRPRDAARICKQVEEFDPDFLPIWNLHGWSLYSAYLSDTEGRSADSLLNVLDGVAKCANRSDPYGQYSPLTRSTFNVLKALRNSEARPDHVLKALAYLDPERLSGIPETVQTGLRTVKIPSLMERYYHSKTRALFDLERWEECADECVRAIESNIQFRGQGRDWIQRRLALALLNMGDHASAAELMKGAKSRLDGWFLWDDLAQVEIARGDLVAARDHMSGALRSAGPIEMKLSALRRMAQICERLNDSAGACLHAALAQAVRLDKGWSLDQDLKALIERLHCEVAPGNVAELISSAAASWRSGDDRRFGVIATLLPNRKAGFIEPEDGGPDIYFKLAEFASDRRVRTGDRVSYVESQGFDTKTSRTTLTAVEVELLEEQ